MGMGWFADQRAVGPKRHLLESLEQLTLDSGFLCNTPQVNAAAFVSSDASKVDLHTTL